MFDARKYERVSVVMQEHGSVRFFQIVKSVYYNYLVEFEFFQGPFDIFSVGGDTSDANVVKFSNDGRLMLLTTMDGHIHVLDSFRGTLVSYPLPTLKSFVMMFSITKLQQLQTLFNPSDVLL